ncbi:ABC transporter ATP-binding protein [Collinsella sp. zg1085]|uniref:ABC transporter ATP-binding protein n=1 Tax=Collinsella sp. zg1085 TaxID=2844380 RepID=UPI001C0B7B65|nr:ABC transporter ATP-binding protein [Collinsella sp. zg1085]QWT18183.1 ABC transporter ATP-binding protein [Collinsella sp. zg1085]
MNAVRLHHVTKVLKGRTIFNDISFELAPRGIYGFFGINGSGKSMLFRAISGLITIDSGEIYVFDKKIGEHATPMPHIGLAMNSGFWDEYTGLDNLVMLASIKHQIEIHDIQHTLERLGLDPHDTRPYSAYSLGMRQRLELAQAIMEKPDLLILDEPANALDKAGIQLICSIIQEERERGATVLLTSHNTPEIEALCEQKFEIYEGSLSSVQG